MTDSDKKILDLHEIARKRRVKVYYNHLLPDEESFISSFNGETYIYLDIQLTEKDEILHFAHEIGHDFVGIREETTPAWLAELYETRAMDWAATYLIPQEDFIRVLGNSYIMCEAEAAEELGVDIETLLRAAEYYKRAGLPSRQCEVIRDWRQLSC